MAVPAVQSVEIEGHTSIREASVELGAVNVLVGANGAGKSNFVRVLELLGRIADEQLAPYVTWSGGASTLIHRGLNNADRIRLAVNASPVSYEAILTPSVDGQLFFSGETVSFSGQDHPTLLVGRLGTGHRETRLRQMAVGDGPEGDVAAHVIEKLLGCRVYHFHNTSGGSPVEDLGPTADNLALRGDGRNVAAILWRLRGSDRQEGIAAYRRISGVVGQVAPFLQGFVLDPEQSDRIRLRWREAESDNIFSAHQMSDGTLRFVCLATLLLQPTLPALVVLDEPELGLHPYAISQLAGLVKQASQRSQVVVATQSVALINEFELEDVIVVEREGGTSVFRRPDAAKLATWLEDYSLGEVWQKNLIGGWPGRARRGIA